MPVVTCVLYFGYNERWKGPRRLSELLASPPGFERAVVDYPIHVIELAWLPGKIRKKLTGDVRIIVDVLQDLRKKRRIVGTKDIPRHFDEVFRLIRAVTHNDELTLPDFSQIPKEEQTMENLMQAYNDKLRREGERKGIKEGKKSVARKMLMMNVDLSFIRKTTQLTSKEILELKAEMEQKTEKISQ